MVAALEVRPDTLPRAETFHMGDAACLPEYWGRWLTPLNGGDMHKVSLVHFYRFGLGLHSLKELEADKTGIGAWSNLMLGQRWLASFIVEVNDIPIPYTKRAATQLYEDIAPIYERIFAALKEKQEASITADELRKLKDSLETFEREFEYESRELKVFSVSEVGTHATTKLLEDAHLNLSADVRSRLSGDVINDIKAAGRCLAFNTPTAAGFHILRAVEPLIIEYQNRVTGAAIPPRSRSWGTYVNTLRRRGGDARIIGMVDHIREFYRNPIMHPEEALTADQALSLFYTCLSAIVQLDGAIQALTAGTAASPPSAPTP